VSESKGDQIIAGYNVLSVVDDKHELIVASEVVNRIDAGQLHAMAKAARGGRVFHPWFWKPAAGRNAAY
jgi:hypothetical protein